MSCLVFISYRRADQRALAEWLYDRLASELHGDEIFLDREALEEGEVFPERIQRAIEAALVFIALVGPQWNPLDSNGNRRLNDARDFIRREVALGIECAANDPRRLFLPVLFDGATMPPADQLPECMRTLADKYNAMSLPPDRSYKEGLVGIVQTVVRRLDDLDTTAPEDKWVIQQITDELGGLDRHRIRRIGQELSRRFSEIGVAPESSRALARSIYKVGPAALECLLTLGKLDERVGSLLELLATHWIKAETAQSLRQTLGDSRVGKNVALECDYADFTPRECLLKASRTPSGWPKVSVKSSDEPQEIVEQIHEDLLLRFSQKLLARKTTVRLDASVSTQVHRQRERADICALLVRRRVDEGRALPIILLLDHRMALDRTLIREVQNAFPPLHFLVATGDPDELKVTGRFAAILTPSDTEQQEKDAYDAYADAQELIEERRSKTS